MAIFRRQCFFNAIVDAKTSIHPNLIFDFGTMLPLMMSVLAFLLCNGRNSLNLFTWCNV